MDSDISFDDELERIGYRVNWSPESRLYTVLAPGRVYVDDCHGVADARTIAYQHWQLVTNGLELNEAQIAIKGERIRQEAKWGVQRHDAAKWMLIAIEEMGEVSQAYLQGDRKAYIKELIQTAAVMVAWLECELARDGDS